MVANLFLGACQGLAWSMTVVMKIDLVGPKRRGLALGFNESAGYLGVATAAFITGAPGRVDRATHPRLGRRRGDRDASACSPPPCSSATPRRTSTAEQQAHGGRAHKISLREAFPLVTYRDPVLRACSQAGLVNNLNDALAWGLAPLYLAARRRERLADRRRRGRLPGRLGARPARHRLALRPHRPQASDRGRDALQGLALALLVAGGGAFAPALLAAILLGAGTAMVYPTLIAAVSDAVEPRDRAQAVGIYRFWRDMGFVVGGLTAGIVADLAGSGGAIALVAALTAASGIWVAVTRWSAPPPLIAAV